MVTTKSTIQKGDPLCASPAPKWQVNFSGNLYYSLDMSLPGWVHVNSQNYPCPDLDLPSHFTHDKVTIGLDDWWLMHVFLREPWGISNLERRAAGLQRSELLIQYSPLPSSLWYLYQVVNSSQDAVWRGAQIWRLSSHVSCAVKRQGSNIVAQEEPLSPSIQWQILTFRMNVRLSPMCQGDWPLCVTPFSRF